MPRPQPRAPRPHTPPTPIINSRAYSEMALKQIGTAGNMFFQHLAKAGIKPVPGLEHDVALLILGYTLSSVAMKTSQGDAANEAQRLLRGQLKSALLAVLRKHYHKMPTDEDKLGANMVTFVDEILSVADSANTAIAEKLKTHNEKPFESLYAKLALPFGGEAPAEQLHARFGGILQTLYAAASTALSKAPTE